MSKNKVYTYSYDTVFMPSMPIIPVKFSSYGEQSVIENALVDSGSDATMVPRAILEKIGARRGDERRVVGVAGFSYTAISYRVQIELAHVVMKTMVVSDRHGDLVLLGRDIINQLELKLNGIAGVTEIITQE